MSMSPIHAFAQDYNKFLGITQDLHDIRDFISDMRLCFVLLTASGYAAGIIYALMLCCRQCKSKRRKRLDNYMYDPGDLEGVRVEKAPPPPPPSATNRHAYSYRQATTFDHGVVPNGGTKGQREEFAYGSTVRSLDHGDGETKQEAV